MNSAEKRSSGLPVIDPPRRPIKHSKRIQLIRVLLFTGILITLNLVHRKQAAQRREQELAPELTVQEVHPFLTKAGWLGQWQANGTLPVTTVDEKAVGFAVHTRALEHHPIGYVGATDLLVFFDRENRIAGVKILESDDTPEHVAEVQNDPDFLRSWNGLQWKEAATLDDVHAVSGATLTCIAIQQTLQIRLGNQTPSVKFPQEVSLSEIQAHFTGARWFQPRSQFPLIQDVYGESAESSGGGAGNAPRLGSFVRTSPVADHLTGFQGPNDLLVFFDSKDRFQKMVLRSSFDNTKPEDFVEYVRSEDFFMFEQWEGLSPEQISEIQLEEVEGASGATMTSRGVFKAMQYAVQQSRNRVQSSKVSSWVPRLTWKDLGTILIVLAASLLTWTGLNRKRWLRIPFYLLLVGYLGFFNGDMLSQTLLLGWIQNGVPWRHSMGMLILSVAAILVPLFSGRNLYCQKICPFGAAQQLAVRFRRKPVRLPKSLQKGLRMIPPALLVLVVFVGLFHWKVNLAAIEPFDAFSITIAGWATLSIALIGLASSLFVPMAYCRFGCPTGRMLEYLRTTRTGSMMGSPDGLACFLFLIGILVFIFW